MSETVIKLTPKSQMPRLVLALGDSVNATFAEHFGGTFRIVGQVGVLDQLEAVVQDQAPDVVLLSRYLPGAVPVTTVLSALRRGTPECRIALLLGALDDEGRRWVKMGAEYGIFNVVAGDELTIPTLTAALTEARTWADIAPLLPEGYAAPAAAPVLRATPGDPPAIPQAVTRYAKIVAVVSGKGGVGKSTISANLLVLAQQVGAVGIDLDYAKPDLLLAFQPEDRQGADLRDLLQTLNLPEGVETLDRRDASLVAEWVDKLPEVLPGITVIPGPARDLVPQMVPTAVAAEILRHAAKKARLVVVDTAFEIADQATLDLLFAADVILVVTTPDQQTVYQTAWLIEQLDTLHVPKGRLKLVVNKAGQKGLMAPKEVAGKLGLPLAAAIPWESARYETARVTRKPIGLREHAKGPLHAIATLILKDIPDSTNKPRRGGFFRRPRKRSGGAQ